MTKTLKKCPSCGALFKCAEDADCWCERYQIHRKDYYNLTMKYTDCLCPDCLKQYAE